MKTRSTRTYVSNFLHSLWIAAVHPIAVSCSVPQCSVLGSWLLSCTRRIRLEPSIVIHYSLRHHLFTDDEQAYTNTERPEKFSCILSSVMKLTTTNCSWPLSVFNTVLLLSSSLMSLSLPNCYGHTLTHILPVTVAEVVKLSNLFQTNYSQRTFIVTSLLNSFHYVFSELLSRLVNLSFNEGQLSSRFKTFPVTPLLKQLGSTNQYLKTTDQFPNVAISQKFFNFCS